MDDNNMDPNNKPGEPEKDSPHDEIPLWLQGLTKRADDEITDKHNVDEWIKEITPTEISNEDVNHLIPDENDLEGDLPDWISELPEGEPEVEYSPLENPPLDKFLAENSMAPENKDVDSDNLISEKPGDTSGQQDFLEISNMASTENQNTEPSWKKDIQDEEELPDWLKEMINERGENTTEDTEPVVIQKNHFTTPDVGSSIEEEDFSGWSHDDTSSTDDEAVIDDQEKAELQPDTDETEFDIKGDFEGQLEDINSIETDDAQIQQISNETFQEINAEETISDFKDEISEDFDDKEIDKFESEPEIVEEFDLDYREEETDAEFKEFPIELIPSQEDEESPAEGKSASGITDAEISDEDGFDKIEDLPEWEVQDESVYPSYLEENDQRQVEEPLSKKENGEEVKESRFDKWVSEIAKAEVSEEISKNKEDYPHFVEIGSEEVNQQLTVGDKVPEYLQTVDAKSEFFIDQDTSPIPVINLEDDNDLSNDDTKEPKYIPKVLEKAKKHLEQGDMNKGLDIIDVYIDESSYLDEIHAWLENLARHPGNLNHRLLTSLGDLALKQGQPEKAFDNYSQAMQYLLKN